MAITSVVEQWAGQDGEFTEGYSRRYVRKFRVLSDDPADGIIAVSFAPGIPQVYDSYISFPTGEPPTPKESDPMAYCRRVVPRRSEQDWRVWTVEVEYETAAAGNREAPPTVTGGTSPMDPRKPAGGPDTAGNLPTLRPPVWKWTSSNMEVPVRKAFSHPESTTRTVSIVNSAGTPPDPLPTVKVPCRVLDYERYQKVYNPLQNDVWLNAWNRDTFLGRAAGTVQCEIYDGEPEWFGVAWLWRVKFRFLFPRLGDELRMFPFEMLDAGFYERNEDGKPIAITDDSTFGPVQSPWPLWNGRKLTLDEIRAPTPTDPSEPQLRWLKFYTERSEPFGPLNISTIVLGDPGAP